MSKTAAGWGCQIKPALFYLLKNKTNKRQWVKTKSASLVKSCQWSSLVKKKKYSNRNDSI